MEKVVSGGPEPVGLKLEVVVRDKDFSLKRTMKAFRDKRKM